MWQGLVHIYTGDGKGKTTAAAGLAARFAAYGGKVLFMQFLKNGISGEVLALNRLGVETMCLQTDKFTWDMTDDERAICVKKQSENLERAAQMANDYELVVLDEAVSAVSMGMLREEELIVFIENKPKSTELVLTGRGASGALISLCDYATEMKLIKHPYGNGVKARKGVEF